MPDDEPTTTVSMSLRRGDAQCFVSLNGVRAGMTAEQLRPLLDTTKLAWDLIRASVLEQLEKARRPKPAAPEPEPPKMDF